MFIILYFYPLSILVWFRLGLFFPFNENAQLTGNWVDAHTVASYLYMFLKFQVRYQDFGFLLGDSFLILHYIISINQIEIFLIFYYKSHDPILSRS